MGAKPDVLAVGPYPAWDLQPLGEAYHLRKLWEAPDRDACLRGCGDVRAVATRGELGADREGGVRITNTTGVLTDDLADMAIALVLATLRRVPAADAHGRAGRWADGSFELVRRFHGCRLGMAGFVDRRAIEALGPEGFLVNVPRGTIVDEGALLDALEARKIAGAGLDVFHGEPRIDPRFAALENVVPQPHHGSGTVETRQAMGRLVRDNLAAHFAGRPLPTPFV